MNKKLIFIFLLFLSVCGYSQTTYYIDPYGIDVGTRNGSISQPWKSLYYACGHVTAPCVIHVNPGTYIETYQIVLPVNVSWEGEGVTLSIVKLRYRNTSTGSDGFAIRAVDGVNNAASISYIKFDGDNYTGYNCMTILNRSNYSIHHCSFTNFLHQGINFNGGSVYATDNKFYNNEVINCAGGDEVIDGHDWGDEGNSLTIDRQTGFRCYNNTITVANRTGAGGYWEGVCIGGMGGTKDCKIYNNVITNVIFPSDWIHWNFAVEFHLPVGMEVYGNTITGEWDTGSMFAQTIYSHPDVGYFNLYFHDNIMGWNTPQYLPTNGLQVEGSMEGVFIARNTFKNLSNPIYFCQYNDFSEPPDDVVENIYVYSNLIYGVGRSSIHEGWGIRFEDGSDGECPRYYDDIYIRNNTIVANPGSPALIGILLPSQAGTGAGVTDIYVQNNIIKGFENYSIYAYDQGSGEPQGITNLYITYNIFNSNGHSNTPTFTGFIPTGDILTGNLTSDPLFESSSDFHIPTSSPAYHSGINVGLTIDRDGVEWYDSPSRGAYEYDGPKGTSIPTVTLVIITVDTTFVIGQGNITDDGGGELSACGLCWSIAPNPTTDNDHTTYLNPIMGVFTSYMTGLAAGTTYRARAYATNEVGTAYSNEVQFTTLSAIPDTYDLLKHTISGKEVLIYYNGQFIKLH